MLEYETCNRREPRQRLHGWKLPLHRTIHHKLLDISAVSLPIEFLVPRYSRPTEGHQGYMARPSVVNHTSSPRRSISRPQAMKVQAETYSSEHFRPHFPLSHLWSSVYKEPGFPLCPVYRTPWITGWPRNREIWCWVNEFKNPKRRRFGVILGCLCSRRWG